MTMARRFRTIADHSSGPIQPRQAMPEWLKGSLGWAFVSKDRLYRYHLTRSACPEGRRSVAFVMLNPSGADHCRTDSTVDSCISLAREWGFRTLEVGNLYALYATNPKDLRNADDPIGQPYNDDSLRCIATRCDEVVVAWGEQGKFLGRSNFKCRANHVLQLLRSAMESARRSPRIHRLIATATADGHPLHPARMSGERRIWDNPYIE